jgi:hypothetical protein
MNSIRSLGLGLVAACLASTAALACFDPGNQTRIFFASVPAEMASPIVANVRVVKLLDPLPGGSSYFGHARVEKVLRGTVKGDLIKLVSHPKSICDLPFRVGEAGIVVGSIRYTDGDLPELAALTESANQRLKRKGATQ